MGQYRLRQWWLALPTELEPIQMRRRLQQQVRRRQERRRRRPRRWSRRRRPAQLLLLRVVCWEWWKLEVWWSGCKGWGKGRRKEAEEGRERKREKVK